PLSFSASGDGAEGGKRAPCGSDRLLEILGQPDNRLQMCDVLQSADRNDSIPLPKSDAVLRVDLEGVVAATEFDRTREFILLGGSCGRRLRRAFRSHRRAPSSCLIASRKRSSASVGQRREPPTVPSGASWGLSLMSRSRTARLMLIPRWMSPELSLVA